MCKTAENLANSGEAGPQPLLHVRLGGEEGPEQIAEIFQLTADQENTPSSCTCT